ncbi:MAG: hypothetical protein ABSB01_17495 [Streptosporangiaceae bacterium]|jgi:hypothetical protein
MVQLLPTHAITCGLPFAEASRTDPKARSLPGGARLPSRGEASRGPEADDHKAYYPMTVDGLSDLGLSYTPPLGSPWEAVQMGTQA